MTDNITPFGTTPGGEAVARIQLAGGGLRAELLTYGARVQDLRLEGHDQPLVLGAPGLEPYLGPMKYFGALVGRFANRIAQGQFSLDGKTHQLPKNWIGKHALHGGGIGSGERVWTIDTVTPDSVRLILVLEDGEMGFPGEMTVTADISLKDEAALVFDIYATTSCSTPCSFAHHGYFNLDGSADITGHLLQVNAPDYLPVDEELIPTGEICPVAGTRFDFLVPREIGRNGLDHNFCLASNEGSVCPVARLHGPGSGLTMMVETNQPGLQVYDGAYMPKEGLDGLEGRRYGPYGGIALETQAWPDTPNRPEFPSAILHPGETYHHHVCYRFERG